MINIRLQRVSDAKRFFEILRNPNFRHFGAHPPSIKAEEKWLHGNVKRMKNNTEWNYTITQGRSIVGAIGVKINYHLKHVGEIGYFVDEAFWGQGIATQAIKLIEKICWKKLKLTRLEILMRPTNVSSEKVAIKNNYQREGLLHGLQREEDGTPIDFYLYAKIKK